MSAEDLLNDTFNVLEEETMKAAEQVQAYQRKVMEPIYHKRRELVKKIPNFWGTAVKYFMACYQTTAVGPNKVSFPVDWKLSHVCYQSL